MSVAQLTLAERCPSIVDISGYRGGASTAAADGALRRISAGEHLNLGGHQIDLSVHQWECPTYRGW